MPLSLGLTAKKTKGVTFTTIMQTTKKAIEKRDYDNQDNLSRALSDATISFEKEEEDKEGPFDLAILAENKKKGAVAVFGSAYAFTDEMNQQVSGRNATLFANTMAYLLPQTDKEKTAAIPVKMLNTQMLTVNAAAFRIFGIAMGIALPLLLLVVGIVICIVRKRR
jgi:ABC-2 type transport system permease protein